MQTKKSALFFYRFRKEDFNITLKEAVGVRVDVDVKTGQKLSHSEVYGRIIDYLGGLDVVGAYIPFPIEELRKKIKEDQWLNNTPMGAWDRAAGFVCRGPNCSLVGGGLWNLYRKRGITSASCSDGVSLLKEAARQLCASGNIKDLDGLI